MFKLSEFSNLLKAGKVLSLLNLKENIVVEGFEHDSRKLKKGQVYVAIKGDNFDGHDFVPNAEKLGASACVVSKKIEGVNITQILVKDTVKAYGDIANYWRRKLKYPIIGITGSNGKTTTKEMTHSVIASSMRVNSNGGNLNNHIGLPYSLLQFPIDADCGITEMGMNHLGEIAYLSGIAVPDFGLITNVGSAHIGLTGSLQNTLKAKTELFQAMRSAKGTISINNNDPLIKKWFAENIPDFKNRTLTFSASIDSSPCPSSDIEVCLVKSDVEGLLVDVISKDIGKGRVLVPIQGTYNLFNIAAALSVGRFLKIDLQTSLNALSKFVPPDMRSNIVEIDGVKIFIDCYNANPDSMKVSIDSVSNIKNNGKKIAVIGDMLELGENTKILHEEIGQLLSEKYFDYLFFIGDYSNDYVAGFNKNNSKAKVSSYSKEEIDKVKEDVYNVMKLGDIVLIKGSRGMKLERIIGRGK